MTETLDDIFGPADLPEFDVPPYLGIALSPLKENVSSEALIGGGVLRDAVLGKEPKDVDVFLPAEREDVMWSAYSSVIDLWGEPVEHVSLSDQYREWNGKLMGMASWEVPGVPIPVQVIWFDPSTSPLVSFISVLLDDFDTGISRIVWDGVKVYHTEDFKQDICNRTVTIRNCQTSRCLERTMARYFRFKERNPDFVLDASLILKGEDPWDLA